MLLSSYAKTCYKGKGEADCCQQKCILSRSSEAMSHACLENISLGAKCWVHMCKSIGLTCLHSHNMCFLFSTTCITQHPNIHSMKASKHMTPPHPLTHLQFILWIQIIRFSGTVAQRKLDWYNPLIKALKIWGWDTQPLMVIVAG